ncbi:branched-chain amino acid ABC transporter permease [Terrihabitans sp. B22-R8]|uniref:branched-chain amino acid ABC transporter permease n=1 Tax=Terrihabitans sp. B22-R8 TaxID=3425128 RepID=UPI00403CCA3A
MLQLAVNTVALGCAYALVALGLVLVLNATNAVNFAHGSLVMLGSYLAFAIGAAVPAMGIVILPLVLLSAAAFGLVLALVAYFPLRNKPVVAVFISTVSAGSIFENLVLLTFGPEPRSVVPIFGSGIVSLGDVVISQQSVAVICTATVLILGQYLLFTRTRFGQRMRAVAQDPEMAAAAGINVHMMIAFTFMLAAALAGAAGMFLSATYYASPTDGGNYMMKAYLAVTIGGWGSIPGTVIGAFMVALFEVLIPAIPALIPGLEAVLPTHILFSMTSSTIALFLTFLAVLLLRPQGLFGEAIKKRA